MLLALLLATSAAAAETPVHAEASASKAEVSVGEVFAVDVKATGPPGTSFSFPAEAVEEQIELRTPAATATSPVPGVHRYDATVFALGEAEVPAVPVRYRLREGGEGEVQTAPIRLKVVSLLPKDAEAQKLADIRGPMTVGVGRAFWIALALALPLLVGLVWWLWRRRRRATGKAAPVVPEVPPAEEAQKALERLAGSGQLVRGEFRSFYIALTAIAKRYLERRLGAPVREMTTTEMLAFLREAPLGQELVGPLRDLATAADSVKFARGAGLFAEGERHLVGVGAAVRALETRLTPADTGAGKAA